MGKTLKKRAFVGIVCLLALLAGALFLAKDPLPGWEAPEELSVLHRYRLKSELSEIAKICEELYMAEQAEGYSRETIDAVEARLTETGYTTVDTDAVYPDYLANPEGLRRFCAGEKDTQTVIHVSEDGGFWYTFFVRKKGQTLCVLTKIGWDGEGRACVETCETLPVYEMELADWDVVYYRLYPDNDPHYIDYNQLRLTPVDRELYDLNREYIRPVGYQMVNLFLCDWQEGDWGDLSFNDLFEYLYEKDRGERFEWGGLSELMLPAELFESTVLPYFPISLEDFRKASGYDAEVDTYPWRPMFGDDLTSWKYPICEPEVVGQTQNSDGTLTLTVQVYSPELKTDRLFTHAVTVRPLENGGFQYTANRITDVSDRGLPPAMPRFALDGSYHFS